MMQGQNNVFHTIKYYAVEFGATVVFVAWLGASVWHELLRIFSLVMHP